jgi:hypothetical protein
MAFEATLQSNRLGSNWLIATTSLPSISTALSVQKLPAIHPDKVGLGAFFDLARPDGPWNG